MFAAAKHALAQVAILGGEALGQLARILARHLPGSIASRACGQHQHRQRSMKEGRMSRREVHRKPLWTRIEAGQVESRSAARR